MNQYGRVKELFIDDRIYNGNDFTILFNIPFDGGEDSNIAEVQIYNLSENTINQIKKDSRIILNAGYTEDSGALLLGVAKSVMTEWQSVDKITTIQVLDGSDAWYSLPVQKAYAEGSTAEYIINDLTRNAGLQVGAFSLPDNRVYKSGKTVKGKLSNVINEIAKECGARSFVTRGKIFIRPQDIGDVTGFILNSKSGLISSPTVIEKEKDGVKKTGWAVKCLLNHRITTDALIQITSRTANGTFKVESGKHNGATYETEMEVYPL